MNTIIIKTVDTPVGEMILGSLDDRLVLSDWAHRRSRETVDRRLCHYLGAVYADGTSQVIARAQEQLEAYFSGRLADFDIPVAMAGSEFQLRVWSALTEIPYGTTVSYAALASRAGYASAIRAVANAVGANALSVIVPCHRVVCADGGIGGYAGGVEAKRRMLAIEQAPPSLVIFA